MEIFQQQHCRFAIYLMDLTQTVLNNADEYNDETSKKTGLKMLETNPILPSRCFQKKL